MKIISKTPVGKKPTWDIEVPNGHEYLLENGCVSHNTAQVLGNNEAFEPFTRNLYYRRVLAGEFPVINKYLVKDLEEIGLWTPEIKNKIVLAEGSIQEIHEIPSVIRDRYKTVWEISQKTIIDMAADRGAFICQSQSMNIHMEKPTYAKLTSMHFYGWQRGLKTGSYYIRSEAAKGASKVTIQKEIEPQVCSIDDPDCLSCSG